MKEKKEYLASVLARLDTMLYRHVCHTEHGKFKHEPKGYTFKLYFTYLSMPLDTLQALYDTKKVVLTIEKM